MTAQITALFENIWNNYLEVTPSAEKVHQLLGSGNDVINAYGEVVCSKAPSC